METKHDLVYRCRMCGETFAIYTANPVRISNIHNHIIVNEPEIQRTFGIRISRHETHVHADGTEGFADYIGYREVIP